MAITWLGHSVWTSTESGKKPEQLTQSGVWLGYKMMPFQCQVIESIAHLCDVF